MPRPPDRDEPADIRAHLPLVSLDRIFDVGAHVGRTVRRFHALYPGSEIWAFEPVAESFAALTEATADLPGVRRFELALGAAGSRGLMRARGTDPTNTVVATSYTPRSLISLRRPDVRGVRIAAGDEVCAEHGVEHVDYLKVDTEGPDLDVLRGFGGMLGRNAIDLVLVEAGMNSRNRQHVPLEAFQAFLAPLGYEVFRLYNQASERARGPHLRRVDALFVSRAVIEAHRLAGGEALSARRAG